MSNPNNCRTCDYTKLNANREGHCYMFRDEPVEVCMLHTLRDKPMHAFGETLADAMADMPELRDELIKAGLVVPNVEHNRRPQGVRVDGPVGPLAGE